MNKLKASIKCQFLILIMIWPWSGHALEKIRVATLNWEPYVGQHLKEDGFTSQIIRKAFKRAGYELELVYMPWSRALLDVQSGKVDAIFPAYYSADRAGFAEYTLPFAAGPVMLFKHKNYDFQEYTTINDLAEHNIAVVKGYVYTPQFDSAKHLNKIEANSDTASLKMLCLKRANLALIDKFTALHLLKTEIPECQDEISYVEPALEYKQLYVAFSKLGIDFEVKVKNINHAIRSMLKNGEIKAIMAEHGF